MNTVKPDSIALFCLTPGGIALARRLQKALPLTCFTTEALLTDGFLPFNGGFAHSLRQAFHDYSSLVVIGATGIVVRALAPVINDKLSDPAVVVMDERGRHVISLLSGHIGGANALTCHLAGLIGAEPVITTATDVNDLAALDSLAQQLDARMVDFRTAVKAVNQMLVSQKRVGLWWDDALPDAARECDTRGFIPVHSLDMLPELDALVCVSIRTALPVQSVPVFRLVPRRVIAGIGCRRDTPFELINTLLHRQLAACGVDPLALSGIGSISLKQNEPGLLELAASLQVPFQVFSADELRRHEHHFPGSDFVRQTTGVGSVSGPAAWLMSQGQLMGETLREQGVTITLGVTH